MGIVEVSDGLRISRVDLVSIILNAIEKTLGWVAVRKKSDLEVCFGLCFSFSLNLFLNELI